MLVARFFSDIYICTRALRPGSQRVLRQAIRDLDQWAGRPVSLEDLTESLLSAWVAHAAQRLAAKTVARRRADLLSIWRLAADMDLVPAPRPRLIRQVRVPHRLPEAFTRDQLHLLLERAGGLPGYYSTGIAKAGFWCAWIHVAYSTALRVGDMLRIPYSAAMDGQFRISQSKTSWDQDNYLLPEALDAIRGIRHPERELLFQWNLHRNTLDEHWHESVAGPALDLPPSDRKNGLQKLRRTAASWAESVTPGAGSRLLGHRDPRMAQRHYLDPRITSVPHLPPRLQFDGCQSARHI